MAVRWVIRWNGKGPKTYFKKFTPLGPMFGATLEQAWPFNTKQEAVALCNRDWRMATTEVLPRKPAAARRKEAK